jgi:flagellar protein FliO/FliZ
VLELVLRIAFSLLVVLGLMWALAKVARRPLTRRAGASLGVLGRQQLTRGASLAVVRVGDRSLILGVTESQVTLLGETDSTSLDRPEPTDHREPVALVARPQRPGGLNGSVLSPATWTQTVRFLRDRTARR